MYKVVIADDESIIRKGLTQLIDWDGLGYEIIGEAANGRDALNLILNKQPDVVICDIRMPILSGLETVKEAREKGYEGKFIILSGFSEFSYAQEAIKYNVSKYLTKPVDEDELTATLKEIHKELATIKQEESNKEIVIQKAREALLTELITDSVSRDISIYSTLQLNSDKYQVIIYEKYRKKGSDFSYDFLDMLQSSCEKGVEFEYINENTKSIILLKGEKTILKFNKIISVFSNDLPPEKNSPLDTVFIECGRIVDSADEIKNSYTDADLLLNKRFFCDQHQHIINTGFCITKDDTSALTKEEIMDKYTTELVNHIQAYNRNKIAQSLRELQAVLYKADLTTEEEKNLLVDLYLHIKEKLFYLYKAQNIPFMANSEAVNIILESHYLYEIISFLSNQFEVIMSSIGYSSRDSIIDDIVHYIDHNYQENITLENIAPLFGYNSSYLGKIFSKKMDVNFNTYLDNIRIKHSKELLLKHKIQVYKVAEMVGYRNVDYFHIKFKKSTGMSPAEYRRTYKKEEE